MTRGIYIVANDKVIDNAIALLNSIRYYDPDVPVFLIPFDEQYTNVASILKQRHKVELFPDLYFVDKFTSKVGEIFERDFLALPNKMRKFVQWFGPLDDFLYIDTDIIVFEQIAKVLDYLSKYEFICCDYHYKGKKLGDIFSPLVKEQEIFSDEQLEDVFNSGFWASKKSIIDESRMYELLRECSQHREYFDFSRKTTDQPILNYIILKSTKKRLNMVKISDKEAGSWAGSKHFQEKDHILYDGGKPLKYLHWAGTPMKPGGPYRELWEYYRYLGETKSIHKEESKWQ
ncbi:MAG: methionine synthase, partial [Moorea sp. SIO2B7]|nr:methionine synthase [Moorena sp. SIO2B7]